MTASNFISGNLALGTGSTSFVELVGEGYARLPITFSPIGTYGLTHNVSGLTFAATGTWPTARQFGIFNSNGDLLLWWANPNPQTISAGQTLTIGGACFALTFRDLVNPPQAASVIFAPNTAGIASAAVTAGPQAPWPGFISTETVTSGVALQVAAGQLGAM